MDNGIKTLIEKEKDAREQVERAILFKDDMRKKALEDADIAVSMILEDQAKIIENKMKEKNEYLNGVLKEKEAEFNKIEASMSQKDLNSLAEKLLKIITGENEL